MEQRLVDENDRLVKCDVHKHNERTVNRLVEPLDELEECQGAEDFVSYRLHLQSKHCGDFDNGWQ